jgi:uncharacterized membrane protein YfcA
MTLYFTAPVLFLVIAFVFSMLGMGGSQLYIPILFWLGLDFKSEAIPLGLFLNIVSSSSAAFTYIRNRMVDWKIALPFAIGMLAMPPVGTWANISLPTRPVILIFALFTALAGALMLSGWKPKAGALTTRQRIVLGLVAGCVLGFFTGLIGRGGGSFVVPLLVMAGLPAKAAAATSSVIVTGSGLSGLLSHLAAATAPKWALWALCAAAVLVGSQAGSHLMAKKMKPGWVKIVFGTVLLGVAVLLIVKDVL